MNRFDVVVFARTLDDFNCLWQVGEFKIFSLFSQKHLLVGGTIDGFQLILTCVSN